MGAPKQPFTETDRAMVAAFQAGEPAAEIARRYGVARSQVYSVLRRAGETPGKHQQWRGNLKLTAARQEVIDYYRAPHGTRETAAHFGLAYGTVRKFLVREGVLRDDPYKAFSDADIEDMARRWQSGESQGGIAKAYGISQTLVSRQLRRRGFTLEHRRPKAEKHGAWRGGRWNHGGYVRVPIPRDHPFFEAMADGGGHVLEHRLVMAESLGRPLTKGESIHHIDGNRANNDISNLQLRTGNHGKGSAFRCAECGSHNIIAVKLG